MVIVGKALVGRLLSGVGGAVLERGSGRLSSRRPRQHLRRQSAGLRRGRAALQVLIDENLIERSAELGDYFLDKLKTIRSPHLREVRGKGLWIGIELDRPARPYCEALKKLGILCKETHDYVIRIAPPLRLHARKSPGHSIGSRK